MGITTTTLSTKYQNEAFKLLLLLDEEVELNKILYRFMKRLQEEGKGVVLDDLVRAGMIRPRDTPVGHEPYKYYEITPEGITAYRAYEMTRKISHEE